MQNRAYSILEIKAVDESARVIKGIATTPRPDRVGDIVVPTGVTYRNPMPMLWQHQSDKPVGTVVFDKPTDKGITFTATLPNVTEPGILKDRVDEAWQSVKLGLVAAVSIGFRTLEDGYELMKNGGIKYLATEVVELSLVTIPAQADAVITSAKSFNGSINDQLLSQIKSAEHVARLASLGKSARPVVRLDTAPAVSGTQEIPGVSGDQKTRRKGVVYLN